MEMYWERGLTSVRSRRQLMTFLIIACIVLICLMSTRFNVMYICPSLAKLEQHYPVHNIPNTELQYVTSDLARTKQLDSPNGTLVEEGRQYVNTTPTVHYVWCKDGIFLLENYLSVMSVVKILKPMKIVFHYTTEPQVDPHEYFTWFQDLRRLPYLVLHPLGANHYCRVSMSLKMRTVNRLLGNNGAGVYIGENTILTKSFSFQNMSSVKIETSLKSQVSTNLGFDSRLKDLDGIIKITENVPRNWREITPCCLVSDYTIMKTHCECVDLKVEHLLYPKYIWRKENKLGELMRWILYDSSNVIYPHKKYTNLAPRISHYIWFGKRKFKFVHYLSVLSAIYVAGFDVVFFHGDYEPFGEYWKRLRNEENVTFVHTEQPEFVYGNKVKEPAHSNDVIKTYILSQYGGVHQDPDVLWLDHVNDEYLAYEAVLGFDWVKVGLWPETFNIGVFMAKKGSRFIKEYIKTFTDYHDERWIYNSALMTYRTYERFPRMLFADRHLQVLCYRRKCHPPWLRGYNDQILTPHAPGAWFDWRRDTLSVHVTAASTYDEFQNVSALLGTRSMFSDIGKYILRKSQK